MLLVEDSNAQVILPIVLVGAIETKQPFQFLDPRHAETEKKQRKKMITSQHQS